MYKKLDSAMSFEEDFDSVIYNFRAHKSNLLSIKQKITDVCNASEQEIQFLLCQYGLLDQGHEQFIHKHTRTLLYTSPTSFHDLSHKVASFFTDLHVPHWKAATPCRGSLNGSHWLAGSVQRFRTSGKVGRHWQRDFSKRPWAAATGNGEVWAAEQFPEERMSTEWGWAFYSPEIHGERRGGDI